MKWSNIKYLPKTNIFLVLKIISTDVSAIHRPRLHRHPRGNSGHGRVPAVVLPLLLHDDQPGALLNLQAGV